MSKESDQLARRLLESSAGMEIRRALERQQKTNSVASSSSKHPLGENEYIVPVTYDSLPLFAELAGEFGKGNVSGLFDSPTFKKHSSCMDIDETPGDRIFLVKHFNRIIRSEEAIAQIDKLYRPATHLEAYAFQKVNPELQSQFLITVLGSLAVYFGDWVMLLGNRFGRRTLDAAWFNDPWPSAIRFLFIRR